jgi:CubicO group peptidase (beta-lactamase class C family)
VGLLGHILSIRAGVPYTQLVKDRILSVLGMDSTGIANWKISYNIFSSSLLFLYVEQNFNEKG